MAIVSPPYNTGSTGVTGGTGYPGDAATGHGQRKFIEFMDAQQPYATPFLTGLKRGRTFDLPKMEWGVRQQLPYQGTLDATMNNSQTTMTVQAGEGSFLQAGMVIYIAADGTNAAEIVWIDDDGATITSTGVTAGLVRAQGGTAADEHLDDAAWYVIGMALPENHDFTLHPYQFGDLYFNYFQRFPERVEVDLKQDVSPNWEDPNAGIFESRLMTAAKDVKIALEMALLFGRRQVEVYDGSAPSMLSGLDHFSEIAGNTFDQNQALLTPYTVQEAVKERWDDVGDNAGNTLLGSLNTKMCWDTTLNIKRRATMSETSANLTFDTVHLSTGPVKLKTTRRMNGIGEGILFGYNESDIQLHNYKGLDWHFRRDVGNNANNDQKAGSISGDFSFSLLTPNTAFKIHDFEDDIDAYPSDLSS